MNGSSTSRDAARAADAVVDVIVGGRPSGLSVATPTSRPATPPNRQLCAAPLPSRRGQQWPSTNTLLLLIVGVLVAAVLLNVSAATTGGLTPTTTVHTFAQPPGARFTPTTKESDRELHAAAKEDVAVQVPPPPAPPPVLDTSCCAAGHTHPGRCVMGDEPAQAPVERAAPLKIGFLTYATGPYNSFVEGLWESIEKHAFVGHERHLYLFTDQAGDHGFMPHPRIHKRHQERLGWPFDSLGRHFLFLERASWFGEMDYMFAIDVDALIVGTLDDSVLGETVGALHAFHYGTPPEQFTYDRRLDALGKPYSAAFIPPGEGVCYYAGGLIGGSRSGFVGLLRQTVTLARADLWTAFPRRMALWHDESYLNRVFVTSPPEVTLGPQFMYPEPPHDAWLHDTRNPNAAAWARFKTTQPAILNLGSRKHVDGTVADFQLPTNALPAAMSRSGRREAYAAGSPLRAPGAEGGAEATAPSTTAFTTDVPATAKTTIIVKAFEREACLSRLLASLAAMPMYTHTPVVVLDDSEVPLLSTDRVVALTDQLPGFSYVRAEHDIGLAEGRNRLLGHVKTPYVSLLDDDFILDETSRFDHLVDVLDNDVFDIVGGCIDSAWSYGMTLGPATIAAPGGGTTTVQQLLLTPDTSCTGAYTRPPDYVDEHVACWRTDMVNNFVTASHSLLQRVKWDGRLKLGEHEDFFLRVKEAGGRVGLCRGVSAINDNSCSKSDGYKEARRRVFDFWVVLFRKWGLDRMTTAAGTYTLVCDADDGSAAGGGVRGGNKLSNVTAAAAPAAPSTSGGGAAGGGAAAGGASASKQAADGSRAVQAAAPASRCHINVQQDNIWFA